MPADTGIQLVPAGEDLLAVTARRIIGQATALPDLTQTIVLLPDLQFAPRLRRQLLTQAGEKGHTALLGPVISTIDHWLADRFPLEQAVPGRARRELMLVEVLQQHPGLFNGGDPWQVSSCLVALFDELTLNRVGIPDDLDAFTERLQSAYGIEDRLPEPLGMEATLVHRIWQAWHAQLNDTHMLDPGIACLQRFAQHRQTEQDDALYLVGFDSLNAAQLEWMQALTQAGRAGCILYQHAQGLDGSTTAPIGQLLQQGEPVTTTDPFDVCLDTVFQTGTNPPAKRAHAFLEQHPDSPLAGRIRVLPASSAEQEARAIDLQVRRWLLAGKRSIAIISEDRRLARRVRALLERAGVGLQDTGGWALSTTSAAAVLERWLETVEEDFAHQPLLDVLKSPFIFPDEDRAQHDDRVHRLEQDIIERENIGSGLQRYREQIERRYGRLPDNWNQDTAPQLQQLLNRLDQAADPLRAHLGDTRSRPAEILKSLRSSLEEAGIWWSFEQDPAGLRIIHEWQLLFDAARHSDIDMSWIEFRSWLGSALERHDFIPETADSPVMLLTLQQAQLGRFDAIVMGACDREHLPAGSAKSPFFNDPVRADLGLPVWPQRHAEQFQRFRHLLDCAPLILLTWYREDAGELRMPSPWLEAIRGFHELAWDDDLTDAELKALLELPATRVAGNNPLPLPAPRAFPRPVLPAALLPDTLSVSMHRQLIDCPYKFFAANGLRLKPREEVREAFEKAEYGTLVHASLEVFHQGCSGYPAAFGEAVTEDNREQAIEALTRISDAVFSRELEDSFEHRAWRQRWQEMIPEYIDWQIQRQRDWTFHAAEQEGETELVAGYTLKGRLDRVDQGAEGYAIIDYKTGGIPKQDEVERGEEVQLPSYALLLGSMPRRVEYLQVDNKVSNRIHLEGEGLDELAGAVKDRLVTVLGEIEAGTPLPAWGDTKTCGYCDMSGLCRRQAWEDGPS